jgi:hypothetical protein
MSGVGAAGAGLGDPRAGPGPGATGSAAAAGATPPDTAAAAETASAAAKAAANPGAGGAATTKTEVTADGLKGAAILHGTQVNLFGAELQRLAPSQPWEDDLFDVRHVPGPGRPVPADEVQKQTDALQAMRVLLVRHAPGRQAEAEAAMRAVLLALQQREPNRKALVSPFDGMLQLHSLCRAQEWRADRRGVVIYIYRSADPATLSFFDNIEQVGVLCDKLSQADCHLLVTAAMPAESTLRDEAELAKRIALWSLIDTRPTPAEPSEVLTGRFDTTLAACAALFPGLGVGEFVSIVDELSPRPAPRPPAPPQAAGAALTPAAPEPPSRHERWWQGDRDAVLAELGVRVQTPPLGIDAGTDAAEAGIFFDDPGRRDEMPSWLYSRRPLLLSEHLETLARRYFAEGASRRFRVGYRRLVQRMDAIGAQRLTVDWLLTHFRSALENDAPALAVSRFAELLNELPDHGDGERLVSGFIASIGEIVPEQEVWLIRQLQDRQALDHAADNGWAPYDFDFWSRLSSGDQRGPIEQAAKRQEAVIDLLLALATRAPAAMAQAVGAAVGASNRAHAAWLRAAGMERAGEPVMSLARLILCGLQRHLLNENAAHWVAFASALSRAHAPALVVERGRRQALDADRRRAAQGRWLAWDCLSVLASVLDDAPARRWPASMYDALVGSEARHRVGEMLAALMRATAPPDWSESGENGSHDEPCVDIASMLWLYQSLAVAALLHEPTARSTAIVADIIAPWRRGLVAAQRARLLDCARELADDRFAKRDALKDRASRESATRSIQALQLVMRLLRAPLSDVPR